MRQIDEEEARNHGFFREDRRMRKKELSEEEKVARREFILARVDVKKIVSNDRNEITPNEIKLQDIQNLHHQTVNNTIQGSESENNIIQQLIQSLSDSCHSIPTVFIKANDDTNYTTNHTHNVTMSSSENEGDDDEEKDPYHDEEAPVSSTTTSSSPTTNEEKTSVHQIKAVCPICLDTYQIGDDVMFSRNKDCPHDFCMECMLNWLMIPSKQDRDDDEEENQVRCRDDCPLCRVDYLKST